ncbi:MAG: hypothetical protein PHE54_04575 [Bacilli bacterium]|nr:hypothetical protein [Bacilli bacterium]
MNININEIIKLHNDLEYLVLSKTNYQNSCYYYLIEVSKDDDIKDNVKIVKENKVEDRLFLIPVTNADELEEVSKLLSAELESNNLE